MPKLIKTVLKTTVIVFTGIGAAFASIIFFIFVLIAFGAGLAMSGETADDPRALTLTYHAGNPEGKTTFLSIPITGLILGDKTEVSDFLQFFSEQGITYGYEVKDLLYDAAGRDDIKGIILEIDSPGGTIFGSKAIADGVAYYRNATGKPVVAYIGGMAASGGYWAAAGAQEVIADSGTAVGSIGVIAGPFKYYDQVVSEDGGAFLGGVVTVGGIQTQYITAGEHKDLGNPYRRLTTDEVASLQGMVNDSYSEFVTHVANKREISEDAIRRQVKALLYGEKQAQNLNLIDSVGTKHSAYDRVASLAKVGFDNYQVKRSTRQRGFWSEIMSAYVPKQTAPSVTGVGCPLHSLALAYHGDVYSLCR